MLKHTCTCRICQINNTGRASACHRGEGHPAHRWEIVRKIRIAQALSGKKCTCGQKHSLDKVPMRETASIGDEHWCVCGFIWKKHILRFTTHIVRSAWLRDGGVVCIVLEMCLCKVAIPVDSTVVCHYIFQPRCIHPSLFKHCRQMQKFQ